KIQPKNHRFYFSFQKSFLVNGHPLPNAIIIAYQPHRVGAFPPMVEKSGVIQDPPMVIIERINGLSKNGLLDTGSPF
ncbi:hypothetical protein, partial [Klebsiella pneumoniae]|uniref:hypothetical protein n=1 Tax=Klebsiella pneumoniae TaxID=573 RepID=UPI001C69A299